MISPLPIALSAGAVAIYVAGFFLAAEWTRRDNEDTHMWTPDHAKPSPYLKALSWPVWVGGTLLILAVVGLYSMAQDAIRARRRERRLRSSDS